MITTLTKRAAEELTDYLRDLDVRVRYLHSDIDSLERTALIRDLRLGVYDVLVGINLLREGLDIPEVALVAVLDADKEGFLRNRTSLIQTCGRAARNVEGRVILYADRRTGSIEAAILEMDRRRVLQRAYNEAHGITPQTIIKPVRDLLQAEDEDDDELLPKKQQGKKRRGKSQQSGASKTGASAGGKSDKQQFASKHDLLLRVKLLRSEMMAAAKNLDFELAARIRDEVFRLEKMALELL